MWRSFIENNILKCEIEMNTKKVVRREGEAVSKIYIYT